MVLMCKLHEPIETGRRGNHLYWSKLNSTNKPYFLIKETIHQEVLTLINIYTLNAWLAKFVRPLLANLEKLSKMGA